MPESKVLTVSEQTHALVNAWCAENGSMKQEHVVALAMQALAREPNGLRIPAEAPEPTQDAT